MGNPTCLEPDFFTLFFVSNYPYGEVFVEEFWLFELDSTLGVGLFDGRPLPMISIFLCIMVFFPSIKGWIVERLACMEILIPIDIVL